MSLRGLALVFAFAACAAPRAIEQEGLLLSGPMVGAVQADSFRLWVELTRPADLVIELRQDAGPWRPQGFALATARGSSWVRGLAPDTPYEYRLRADGILLPNQHGQSLRTAPSPGTWKDFSLGFGSCAGDWGTDPTQGIFLQVAEQNPDLFLWLGDNVYYDYRQKEWESPMAMENRWRVQRALPALGPLLAGRANLATWDDHDYGPDNADGSYPLKSESLRLFDSYWANPAAGGEGEDGVYFSMVYGGVEFFFLDTRFDRSPVHWQPAESRQLLSAAQWVWLEQGLRQSQAAFKVVVSGMQILADYHRFESWRLYPSDRQRLYEFLAQEGISGVLFLSGDRHIGEVLRREEVLSYPLYEFTASPLAAGIGESTPDSQAPERIPGSEIQVEHFAMLRFSRAKTGLTLRYEAFDRDGLPVGKTLHLGLEELQVQD